MYTPQLQVYMLDPRTLAVRRTPPDTASFQVYVHLNSTALFDRVAASFDFPFLWRDICTNLLIDNIRQQQ